MTKKICLGVAICLLMVCACTDADWSQFGALGSSGEVTCYSGEKVFYHGFSTGKIATEKQSDGWYFQEKGSNALIRVSGACLIRN